MAVGKRVMDETTWIWFFIDVLCLDVLQQCGLRQGTKKSPMFKTANDTLRMLIMFVSDIHC